MGIEHKTGPTDLILRYDEGGGMIGPAWTIAQAPIFSLFGDGTLIFRNPRLEGLPPVGSTMPLHPFRTAKMNEEQIQALLESALGEGGLANARPEYPNNMVTDAGSSVFTINAAGLSKTVSVYALGMDSEGVPDLIARKSFERLRDKLTDIDKGGTIKTDVYTPERYRGVLFEGQPGAPDEKKWPWPDIKTSEFVSDGDPNAFQLPARVLTVADVERLGFEPYVGGFSNLPLAGPGDRKVYTLSLRPLLPDDKK